MKTNIFTDLKIDEAPIVLSEAPIVQPQIICDGRRSPTVVQYHPYFIDPDVVKKEDDCFNNKHRSSCNNYNYIIII
jgi:hypothetical protein